MGKRSQGDDLSRTFAALGDPTRRAMLSRLAAGAELSMSELAEPLPIQLPAVTKHLTILSDAGLVRRRKVGRTVYCRLARPGLTRAARWLARTSAFWERRLDNLEDVLENGHGRR